MTGVALHKAAQARGAALPRYELAARSGPAHAPEFVVSVCVAGKQGTGTAGSMRAAEQAAAQALLAQLQ